MIMKTFTKFSWLIALIICIVTKTASAQTKADVFNPKVPVTWLGIDFTQMKFLGVESEYKLKGEVINSDFVGRYIPAWANLFITEPKTYDVAKAIHRDSVHFAFKVTEKVNNAITKNFFTEKRADLNTLKEKDIQELVKNYDFQGQKGIGMMFFVESMDKSAHSAGAWVTFINMDDKSVIFTVYKAGDSRGFGFRNYWAHSWYNILKDFRSDFSSYKNSFTKN